jgi:hypothetical protein
MNAVAALSLPVAAASLLVAAGRLSARAVPELPAYGRAAIAGSLAVAGFLAATCIAARATGNLDVGLFAAALAGVFLARALGRVRRPVPVGPRHPEERATTKRLLAVLLVVGAIYAVVAWKYQIHDEHPIFGHKSMVEMMRWNSFPPHLPPFPFEEAHYHYGFDVLAAALMRAFGLGADTAIDLVTVALALLISLTAAAVAADAGAERSAPFAALAIHFGAGLAFVILAGVAGRHPRCLIQYHHPSCSSELFPTPFLNVFQHPVSAGVPLWLASLPLAKRTLTAPRGQERGFAALGLVMILPALSLGQIVYYALGSLAALSAALVWTFAAGRAAIRERWRGAVFLGLVLAAGLGLARVAGGMLSPSTIGDPTALYRHAGFGFPGGANWIGVLRHHAINLGLPFVLVPLIGVLVLLRRRFVELAIMAFAAGGALVPHLWSYRYSWDIVKFPSAAAFALTMIYVIVVDRALIERRGPLGTWVRRFGRALLIGEGLLAATYMIFPLDGEWRLYDTAVVGPDPLVAQTIAWWRSHGYQKDELIYVQSNVAPELAAFGGLSVAAADYDLQTQGIRRDLLASLEARTGQIRASMDRRALSALHVRWVMFSGEEFENLGPEARTALSDPLRFEQVAEFPSTRGAPGTRRIWRVRG